jgi:hypothetical protein
MALVSDKKKYTQILMVLLVSGYIFFYQKQVPVFLCYRSEVSLYPIETFFF